MTFAICQNTNAYNPYGLFVFVFDVAILMIIHMRNKPNLAISQRRVWKFRNSYYIFATCWNLLSKYGEVWKTILWNLATFALFLSQKTFAWVSLDLIYFLPSNFMMSSRWQSSISQFNQIRLSTIYEKIKNKLLYICFGYILEPSIEI